MSTGRRDLVIGTAGHIDHGKTALVRALSGVDTDRLPAEKLRGITIDLGFARLDLGDRRVALVDVPGHERFIRNMLAGASGLDLAMLIVAADDSVMPQTREHLEILQILGLAGGVLVITKSDLVDPTWLSLVEDDVRTLVAGTFLESAEIVRTSSTTGFGIADLKASLARVCDSSPVRDDSGLFRMAIDRAFTLAGHGTIVTGTIASGEVAVGDDLEWLPSGRVVRARGLHHHDRAVERLGRGMRAAINLTGVHHTEIHRGHELAVPGYLKASRILSVEIRSTEADADARSLKHRRRYRVHLGTAEVSATLVLLETDQPDSSGKRLGQLFLAEPQATVHGQPFVIRAESPPETLGGGRVLQPTARQRIRPRDTREIDRLRRLTCPDPLSRLAAAIASFGLNDWSEPGLSRESGVPIDEVESSVRTLLGNGALTTIPVGPRRRLRILAEVAEVLEGRVIRALGRLHAASPRFSTIGRSRVASSLADLNHDSLVFALIDRLIARGPIVGDGRSIALKEHQPKLSQAERKLKLEIAEAYRRGGFTPPDPSEWLANGSSRQTTVKDLLALLVEEEQIVEVASGLYLAFETEQTMRSLLFERLTTAGVGMTMAELRDLLGTSRKFAVPIAEYLDRIGWTRRDGDLRTLGAQAVKVGLVEQEPSL